MIFSIDTIFLNINSILVITTALLLVWFWYRRPVNFPPGPRGIPVLGAAPFAGVCAFKSFLKWSKQYGPIFSARMGSDDWVILNDYESIYQAFVKRGQLFSGRPQIEVFRMFSEGLGVVFRDDGAEWRTQRKFGLQTLKGFGVGKRSMEERINEELTYVVQSIESQNQKPFSIKDLLSFATSNVICSVIMGCRYEYDDENFKKCVQAINRAVANEGTRNQYWFACQLVPVLRFFPPFIGALKSYCQDVSIVTNFVEPVVVEHKKEYDESVIRDFIDEYTRTAKKKSDDSSFTDRQLLIYIRDLFSAGEDTSSATLRWSLVYLLNYPDAQKKIHEEIEATFGDDGCISYSERSQMPFTCAFIQEVYRCRPIAPMAIPHKATADVELNGYTIPKNTTVVSNLWAVNMNPNEWNDPDLFQPHRHLDSEGKFVPSSHVITFGVGGRQCLGEQLARMEVFIFIVTLLRRFEFLPDPDSGAPSPEAATVGLTYSPLDFKMIAKKR